MNLLTLSLDPAMLVEIIQQLEDYREVLLLSVIAANKTGQAKDKKYWDLLRKAARNRQLAQALVEPLRQNALNDKNIPLELIQKLQEKPQ
ncbi:MAG: hypothetical protein HS114_34965 [Anaerolineales bacterium]|nr:hypothetical protein [Anaerolineales bacterium]